MTISQTQPRREADQSRRDNELKELALHYHHMGFNLVPWAPDKAPVITKSGTRFTWKHWNTKQQTTDDIARFPWHLAAGIAAVCGPISGDLVCVDFDHPQDQEALRAFLRHLELTMDYAWIVRSPGGGYHVWLCAPDLDLDGKGKLDVPLPGGGHVELRYTRHCTALPPTINQEGKCYEYINDAIPTEAPAVVGQDDLLHAYQSIGGSRRQPQLQEQRPATSPFQSPYVEAALRNEAEAVRSAAKGTRNNRLNQAAFSLGQLVGAQKLDRSVVENTLLRAAMDNGLPQHEAYATIASGINIGLTKPRQMPLRSESNRTAAPEPSRNHREQAQRSHRRRPRDKKRLTKNLADAIQSDHHFARDAGGRLYHLTNGAYTPDGEDRIGQYVKAQLQSWGMEDQWSTHRTREVAAYIGVDAPLLWQTPPMDRLNVQNGIINVSNSCLLPHASDFLSPIQLPVTYVPGAFPVFWDRFCRSTFPEDAYEAGVPWQIIAWLMLPNTSLQKALMLLGDGGNGKSRYLAGIKAFLGISNVTALSLQKIENDRFAIARLLGKLGNICPDLPTQHLQETAIFKQLTGDDGWLTGEFKGKDSFEFPCFARLVFSANRPPMSNDNSEGFYRRWCVIPFSRTFTGTARADSREIDARLAAPEELSGVLNLALQYLPQVLRHGITETESMKQAHREFREVTDPFAVWLDEHTYLDERAYVEKDALRKEFNRANGTRLSPKAFTQALRRLRPSVKEGQRNWQGKRAAHVYIGLACHSGIHEMPIE